LRAYERKSRAAIYAIRIPAAGRKRSGFRHRLTAASTQAKWHSLRSGSGASRQVFAKISLKNRAACANGATVTIHRENGLACYILFIWLSLFTILFPNSLSNVHAQSVDSYEGGGVRWQLVESDCAAQLTQHEISLIFPHSGQTCELFELATGNGTSAILAYPIEPCLVLPEFEPRIWVRCASAGIRFGVRVVFPSAKNPITGGRITTMLWSSAYKDSGNWQALKVSEMNKLLDVELISLRQRFGPAVAIEDAFIDALVLEAYTGPGRYRMQVDDLSLRGLLALPSVGRPIPVNWRETWAWRPEEINPEGRYWTALNRPEVWLHYQNESLPWLKSLGISGLVFSRLPSEDQLQAIYDAKLSVVSPPPTYDVKFDTAASQAIRGWLIGSAMMANQVEQAKKQVARISQMQPGLSRPVFGEALEQLWQYSRIADEVIVPAPDAMSAGTEGEHTAWLRTQLSTIRDRSTGYVAIATGAHPQWISQYRAAQKLIEPDLDTLSDIGNEDPLFATVLAPTSSHIPKDAMALRRQMIQAMTAGARGYVLRSYEPLELYSVEGRAQAASLRWTINDLGLWGPWIVAGQPVRPPTSSRPDYAANAWVLHNSYLMVVYSAATTEQRVENFANPKPLIIATALAGNARSVIRLTLGEHERLETTTSNGGLQWTIREPQPIETFVISDNPNVLRFLNQHMGRTRLSNAEDQLELAAYQLGQASQLLEARFPDAATPAARGQLALLSRSRQRMEDGLQAMRRTNATVATRSAMDSMTISRQVLDDAEQVVLASLSSPQSSPFALMPGALKYHWKVASACERSRWRELPIAGSDLSSLDTMLRSGWDQKQRLQDVADLRVEWIPPSVKGGQAIRMAAYQKPGQVLPSGFEGASLRIRSAAAQVKKGQLVRIQALARIRLGSPDPNCGLLVYDNQGGPALGQFVRGNAGEVKSIELYRFVVNDGEFRILAECRGQCDITLEALNTSVIEPATNLQAFPTSPIQPAALPESTNLSQ
jgi:hypothetical protein